MICIPKFIKKIPSSKFGSECKFGSLLYTLITEGIESENPSTHLNGQ